MAEIEFDTYLLFFFSALGVLNGLVLTIYFLIIAKPWHISNGFFAALLLVLCIRIGKSLFFYFNKQLSEVYIHIGISACFFIGPLMLLYCHSIVKPDGWMVKNWKWHLGLLAVVIGAIGFYFPYRANFDLWQDVLMNTIYAQWLIYMLLSGLILQPLLVNKFASKERLPSVHAWAIHIYFGVFLILLSYLTVFYTSYIAGALTFSVITYFLLLFFILNKNNKSVLYLNSIQKEKQRISASRAAELIQGLKKLMQEDKLYLNPNLKSETVASKLGISVHQLSKVLNEHLGKRFSELINTYRVDHSKKLLRTHKKLTLEAIGNESGFNSKTSFYNAFKKSVGQTPAQFAKQY